MNSKYRILAAFVGMALWLPYVLGFAFELLVLAFHKGQDDVIGVLEELEERSDDEREAEFWDRDN